MTPLVPRRWNPCRALPPVVLFVLLVLTATRGNADNGFFRLQLENDLGWTDRYYTHGTRIDRMYPALSAPVWTRRALDWAGLETRKGDLAGWYLGQLMFTPSRLDLEVPDPDDRPFGGWLYLGVQRYSFGHAKWTKRGIPYRNTHAFSVGVTGRWSGAEAAQKGIHWIGRKFSDSGFIPPRGWDYQIPTEPTLDVFLERKWKLGKREKGLSGEILPYINTSLGTVNDVARGGATIRAGWNLPDDFAHSVIPSTVPQAVTSFPRPDAALANSGSPSAWGAHVFVTTEGKWVGRNAFYDGALFRDSRHVRKETWVYDLIVGFTLSVPKGYLTYSHVSRSKEFKAQATRQEFHSVSLTWIY